MYLTVDIGNSNIVVGVYSGSELKQNWRMETDKNKSADEYGVILTHFFEHAGLDPADVEDVIISTVVPSMTYTMQHLSQKYFGVKAMLVSADLDLGIQIKYDNPNQLGADRIVDAVAAYTDYPAPLIVMDFGTATTIDAVSSKGEYLGGAIVPGVKVASDALFDKTAKLQKVELEAPGRTICTNTIEGIQSGVIYGSMGMVEYLVRKMKAEICAYEGEEKPVTVVATGGLSTLICADLDCVDHIDKQLTLTGLRILYERNKGRE